MALAYAAAFSAYFHREAWPRYLRRLLSELPKLGAIGKLPRPSAVEKPQDESGYKSRDTEFALMLQQLGGVVSWHDTITTFLRPIFCWRVSRKSGYEPGGGRFNPSAPSYVHTGPAAYKDC